MSRWIWLYWVVVVVLTSLVFVGWYYFGRLVAKRDLDTIRRESAAAAVKDELTLPDENPS